MRKAAILIGLVLPITVSALEFRNLSLLYTDAPFTPSVNAGVSLLTSIDAVSGYPDGSFQPNRTLNRAEFLKIALASYPKVRVSPSDAANCFPDVSQTDWFAQYVCLAKKRSIIAGYPDGEFKPARTVNYAEALKILGELYDYVAYSAPDEEWYAGYVRAAEFNKTALPVALQYDRALTRGQMARLAAAYRANYEGQLEMYRLSERSFDAVIAQEIANNKQSSSSSVASSESTSSVSSMQSSSETVAVELPAKSRFLLLGSTQILASGQLTPRDEYAVISNVKMEFRDEAKNIKELYLVDGIGKRIATLTEDVFDPNERTWIAENAKVVRYVLPPEGRELAIQAVLKDLDEGHSEELIQVKWISMNVTPLSDETSSYQIIANNTSYPPHQTAMAHITSVSNNRPPVMDLNDGEDMLLAEFTIAGEALGTAPLSIDSLTLTAEKNGVSLEDFTLAVLHDSVTMQCSLGDGIYINCQNIPAAMGFIEQDSVTFQLYGTMTVNTSVETPTLKINIQEPGIISTSINPGKLGDILWSDGTGNFRWVDLDAPLATGSEWR